ncbi:hypothetical protein BDV11DRAFT_135839 [Aspergillus similis]
MLAGSHTDKMMNDASSQSFRQRPLPRHHMGESSSSKPTKKADGPTTPAIITSARSFGHSCHAALKGECQVGPSPAAFWPCQAASCHPGLGRHRSWNRKIIVDVTLCGIQSTYRLGRHTMADAQQTSSPLRRRGRRGRRGLWC